MVFYLIAPFGGPLLFVDIIKRGFYAGGKQEYIATLSACFGISIYLINTLNRVVALIYFSSILLGSLPPFFYKMKMKNKFKISVYCFLISLVILFTGKFLSQFY